MGHPAAPHITVVLLNWNGWRDTLACLGSLANLTYRNASVVVVDNASTDGSRAELIGWMRRRTAAGRRMFESCVDDDGPVSLAHGDLIYIQSATNGGFAAGNNQGIRFALARGTQYVWILNNDTEVEPDALTALFARVASDPAIGMCGSLLIYHDARHQVQAWGGVAFDRWRANGVHLAHGLRPEEVAGRSMTEDRLSYVVGASMLVSAAMIREVGLMEERYFLYYEELDWAERARPRWQLAVAADSIVYHKEGGSIGTSSRSQRSVTSQYYLNRNLLLFYARFYKWLLPIAVARVLREAMHRAKARQWALARTTMRGLLDGVRRRDGNVGKLG